MTPDAVKTFRHFSVGERRMDGKLVNWAVADYEVFYYLDQLRGFLDSPLTVIREQHPDRPKWPGAVDATCPGRSLEEVFLALTRLPGVSFGLYSGNSFHIDRREEEAKDAWPARWFAVKPDEVPLIRDRGWGALIQPAVAGDSWAYLSWGHEKAFRALAFVLDLAENRRSTTGGIVGGG